VTAGTCKAICTPGTLGCNGAATGTCNSTGDGWLNSAVTPGFCGAVCSPGGSQCCDVTTGQCGTAEGTSEARDSSGQITRAADTIQTQVCSSDGQWVTGATCTFCAGGGGPSGSTQAISCAVCSGTAACKVGGGSPPTCVCP
jgi:hypothetical protein